MSTTKIDYSLDVESSTRTCECGIVYAVPAVWLEARRRDHATFYCPNGHARHFPQKSDEERLRENLKWYERRLETETAEKEAARRSLAATRGVLTRTKNRIAAGTCPCCNKEFKVLAKHMAAKHPEYLATDGEV